MPKVTFVKKAQKNVKGSDIKKGEEYYWWKFRFGGKHVSRTPPKPSQLTRSAFLSPLYELQERIILLTASDTLPDEVSSIVDELRCLGEEQLEKQNNMPESLQDSETGQLLQDRSDNIESMVNDLEAVDLDSSNEPEKEEEKQKFWEEKLEEIQGIEYQGE